MQLNSSGKTLLCGLAEELPVDDGDDVVPVTGGLSLLKVLHVLPEQQRMDCLVVHHEPLKEFEVNRRLHDFNQIPIELEGVYRL